MTLKDNTITNSKVNAFPAMRGLNSFLRMILKKWWLFLTVGIFAGIGGIIYAGNQKPVYKSSLTFALDDAGSASVGGFMSLASQFGLNIGDGKNIFAGDNIINIMKSRKMIEKVLLSSDTFNSKTYTLIEYYLKITGKFESNSKSNNIHFPGGQPRATLSYSQDSLLYNVYNEFKNKNIVADRPDRKLSIFEVNVISPDEEFTKHFTDKIVAATNNFYIEIRTKKAKETLDILEQRATVMKDNLNSSITNRAAVQDVNINPVFSEAQVPVQKQQANIQVYASAYSEIFKNLEMARFQYVNKIPLMQIIDAADYPMQKIKTGKLKTAIVWSFVSCFLLIFVFWVIRIVNYDNTENSFK